MLNPSLPPSGNFDLSHWKLTLPLPGAPEVKSLVGYSNPPYFLTAPDGAMTFFAPVTGGSTTNSSDPRSELRELISPPSSSVNWNLTGLHTLSAVCKVLQLPSSGKVIIGQIHAYTGKAYPLCKLFYRKGGVEVDIKKGSEIDDSTSTKVMKVAIGDLIDYQIVVTNGILAVNVAVNGEGKTKTWNILKQDPGWSQQTFYFKAGAYCIDHQGPASEGAKVAFYKLSATHS